MLELSGKSLLDAGPPGVRSGRVAVRKNVVLGEALFGIGKSCLVLESFKMAETDLYRINGPRGGEDRGLQGW